MHSLDKSISGVRSDNARLDRLLASERKRALSSLEGIKVQFDEQRQKDAETFKAIHHDYKSLNDSLQKEKKLNKERHIKRRSEMTDLSQHLRELHTRFSEMEEIQAMFTADSPVLAILQELSSRLGWLEKAKQLHEEEMQKSQESRLQEAVNSALEALLPELTKRATETALAECRKQVEHVCVSLNCLLQLSALICGATFHLLLHKRHWFS